MLSRSAFFPGAPRSIRHLLLALPERRGNAALVRNALDDGEEIVPEVLLVLKRADAVVADVRERLEDLCEVDLAARQRNRRAVRLVHLEVLDVGVVDALAVLADRLGGILAGAVLPADAYAEAEAPV